MKKLFILILHENVTWNKEDRQIKIPEKNKEKKSLPKFTFLIQGDTLYKRV